MPAEEGVVRRTLARMTGATGSRLDALTAGTFTDFAMCFSDLVSTNRQPAARLHSHVARVEGAERVAHLQGGFISLTAHVGNWELAGRLLAGRAGRTTHVVVAEDEALDLGRWVRRDGGGMRFVPRSRPTVSLELVAALRRGEVVAVQGDRALGTRGDVLLPFFGAPAPFPLGPFVLARAVGVPLVPAFCMLDESYRYTVTVTEPLTRCARRRGGGGARLGGGARADRGRAPDPVVQLLRRVEPACRVTSGGEAAEALGTLGRQEAARSAAFLREALPGPLRPAFGEPSSGRISCTASSSVGSSSGSRGRAGWPRRSAHRANAGEIAARAGLVAPQAQVPVDWMLRFLAARGWVAEVPGGANRRYRLRGELPLLDALPVRQEQQRWDPSWMPAYALADTVARDYPAFLRGDVAGEDVLFAPRRLRLWVDYFSNDNGLYAVNNRVGAVAASDWLPWPGSSILELGGGLASGALALLAELEARDRLRDVRGVPLHRARVGVPAPRRADAARSVPWIGRPERRRARHEPGVRRAGSGARQRVRRLRGEHAPRRT